MGAPPSEWEDCWWGVRGEVQVLGFDSVELELSVGHSH